MKHFALGLCLGVVVVGFLRMRPEAPREVGSPRTPEVARPAAEGRSGDAAPVQERDVPSAGVVAPPRAESGVAGAVVPAVTAVLPAADRRWRERPPEPAFAAFQDWVVRHEGADASSAAALAEEGLRLAVARRGEMRELMLSQPERALELAVPRTVRARLPEAIQQELEEWVSAKGDHVLLSAVAIPGDPNPAPHLIRQVWIDGRRYRATTHGRRLREPTRFGIPLAGIALGEDFVLAQSAVRRLEAAEVAEAVVSDPVCRVSGLHVAASAGGEGEWVEVGGDVMFACGSGHLGELDAGLAAAAMDSDATDAGGAARPRSAYTEGTKRAIFIRVDFADLAGAPFSDTTGTNLLNGLNTFFREQSYNRTGFSPFAANGSAMTPTLRLPNTAAYYGSRDASEVRSAARSAATAAGFNLSAYNFDFVCFGSVPGFGWAGLGYVGAPGSWIRASFDASAGVVAHELGHNLGLNHANFWDTGGESVVGPGTSVEYGDSFDTMGNASGGRRHFNARYKNFLGWMPNSYVRTVLTNGTYRVHSMDSTNEPTVVRALSIRRNSRTNYWVEARQRWSVQNRWADNGVGVRWGQSGNQASLLLDTTPGSADGKNDSPVVVGRTFSDRVAGVHITPLAKGGADPVWYDVAVRFGNPTNNAPPTVQVTGSAAAVAVNGTVNFTAQASDTDDRQIAYSWDFGDGTFGANSATVSKSFTTAGEYVVRCVVSDLRGGTGSDSYVVRVGSPNTLRISGRVSRDGRPLEGVRVYTSNTKQTFTDSDGTYILAGLARGGYTLRAAAENLLMTRVGFSNPVDLQSNRASLDFEASAPGDLQSVTLVPLGAEWRYYDRGTLPAAGWTSPAFDDSGWNKGPAQLGYGDDDIVTTVGFGPNPNAKYITTWFRHEFTVEDPGRLFGLMLGLIRDDGAIVYLNGREVFRSNMPTGTVTPTTLASSTVGGTDESTLYEADLDTARLVAGRNVLAVELHQSDAGSSDLSFQLQLTGYLEPVRNPVVTPRLAGDELVLSWPAGASGYRAESSNLPVGPWEAVSGTVQTVAGESVIRVPLADGDRFFRLRRP